VGKKGRGADHPELAYALTGTAKALVGLGRGAEARDAANEALAIRTKQKEPLPLIAESRFVLAKALWLLGDRSRALGLVGEARKELVADGESQERIADLDAWVKAHP
jgi:tetratricopeptide (TPR) repeat protein